MSSRLAVTIDDPRRKDLRGLRPPLQHQLAQATRRRPLQPHERLPKPIKYGKGKVISTAQDILEDLATEHPVPAQVLEHRQLAEAQIALPRRSFPQLTDAKGRIHTTFNQVGTSTGRLSSINPNLQNIPIRTALGREIRAAFIAAPGNLLMSADYSQIELRLMAHFSQDPLLLDAYRTGKDIHTLTAAEVFEVDPATMSKESPRPRQGRQLRHRLRHQPLRPLGPARHRPEGRPRVHRPLLRPLRRRPHLSSTRPSKTPSAAPAPSPPTSAASAPSPTSSPATPTSAASPNAPPSTRPCKAPPPISSSSP